nr:MAG TPA: endonuclease [Caudoviricetes sp.]
MLEIRYEEAARLFTYDRDSGVLYWRIRNGNTIRRNYVAGSSKGNNDGYRQVGIKGKIYQEHRIIMMLCFGHIPENAEIDHINHVRDDNRLCNLRFVTGSENNRNKSVSSRSTTGVTGVTFDKNRNKYRAQIRVNRKAIYLGIFETLEEAAAARAEANLKFNFNNNHGKGRSEYVKKR